MTKQPLSIFTLEQFMQLSVPIYNKANRDSVEHGKVCNAVATLSVFYDDELFYVFDGETLLYSIQKSYYYDKPIAQFLEKLWDVPIISSILTKWNLDSFNKHSDEPVTQSGYPAGGYFDFNWAIEACQQLDEPKDDFDPEQILLKEFPLYSCGIVFNFNLYVDEEVFSPKL